MKEKRMKITAFKVETQNHIYPVIITEEGFEVAGVKGTDLHLKVGDPLRLTGGKRNLVTLPVKKIFR